MENTNNKVEKAIVTALQLHKEQLRKGDKSTPYIVHPITVGITVSLYTFNPDLIAAGILHDTLEDCDYTREQLKETFGPEVTGLVVSLTEDKSIADWEARKLENINRLRQNKDAYFIKACDALSNMQSLTTAISKEGPVVWERFNSSREQKLAYFKIILNDTLEMLPNKFIEDYVSSLKDLEYVAKSEGDVRVGFGTE